MAAKEKNKSLELSKERSKLAVQRTILANARTFSAWVRTGLSIVLAGLAIVGFIGEFQSFSTFTVLIGLSIGILFVLLGILIYVMAYITYKKSMAELTKEEAEQAIPLRFLFAVTAGMVLTALLIALLLLFL